MFRRHPPTPRPDISASKPENAGRSAETSTILEHQGDALKKQSEARLQALALLAVSSRAAHETLEGSLASATRQQRPLFETLTAQRLDQLADLVIALTEYPDASGTKQRFRHTFGQELRDTDAALSAASVLLGFRMHTTIKSLSDLGSQQNITPQDVQQDLDRDRARAVKLYQDGGQVT